MQPYTVRSVTMNPEQKERTRWFDKQSVTTVVRSYLFWMRLAGLMFCLLPFGALYGYYINATTVDDYRGVLSMNLIAAVLVPFLFGAVILHMAEREELNKLINKIVDEKIHAMLAQGRLPKTSALKTIVVPREKEVVQNPE